MSSKRVFATRVFLPRVFEPGAFRGLGVELNLVTPPSLDYRARSTQPHYRARSTQPHYKVPKPQ